MEDITLFFKDSKEFEIFLRIIGIKNYEFYCYNKTVINNALNEYVQAIYINGSNREINNLSELFFVCLLIKEQHYYNNYVYKFEYINILNNYLTKQKKVNKFHNSLLIFIISFICNELIDGYKLSKVFYDKNYEKELKDIYENNKRIINDYLDENEFGIDFHYNNYYNNYSIEELYLQVIFFLIKNEKLIDYEYSCNILEQLDLKSINLTKYMFNELEKFFIDENMSLKNYLIKDINNLFNEKIINFYYILIKYVFKIPLYIYNINFLLKTKKNILNIIKNDADKIGKCELNKKLKEKMEYIIEFFCDSEYYYVKTYNGENFFKIKEILKYYKNVYFETKKDDIKNIENFILNVKQ